MHDASADVGSTAKTSPAASAASITRFVTTPAPQSMVGIGFRAGAGSRWTRPPRGAASFSVLMTAERVVSGTAPPVYPVPPPRGMIVSPSSMQPATSPRTSSSVSGHSTTNGYSTRQSVASVTCDTRAKPSNAMLSRCVARASTRTAFARSAAISPNERSNRSTADCAAATSCATLRSRSDSGVADGARVFRPALLDLVQPVPERGDQQPPALRIVEEVVLQVRIALDDPDVAQHLEQHPGGPAGAPLAAQLLQQPPHRLAEQADHDLAVGERRVVVGDLAQPRGGGGVLGSGNAVGGGNHGSGQVYRSAT